VSTPALVKEDTLHFYSLLHIRASHAIQSPSLSRLGMRRRKETGPEGNWRFSKPQGFKSPSSRICFRYSYRTQPFQHAHLRNTFSTPLERFGNSICLLLLRATQHMRGYDAVPWPLSNPGTETGPCTTQLDSMSLGKHQMPRCALLH
jgi:hypothetical protein